jgi:hypothetical protein
MCSGSIRQVDNQQSICPAVHVTDVKKNACHGFKELIKTFEHGKDGNILGYFRSSFTTIILVKSRFFAYFTICHIQQRPRKKNKQLKNDLGSHLLEKSEQNKGNNACNTSCQE